jgi:lysophospholipase L1-like esterase
MMRFILAGLVSGLIGALAVGYVFVSRPWLASQQHDRFFEKPGAGSYQKNRRAFTARQAAQAEPGRIWFIGHSHVEGLDVAQVDPRGLGLGIGGETMDAAVSRLGDYTDVSAATAVVLALGGNDVASVAAPDMRKKAQAVVAVLPADMPIIWSMILPTNETLQPTMTAAKLAATRAAWADICMARPRCVVSDAAPQLADTAGQLRDAYHIGDGEHLNAAGYAVWREVLKADIARALGTQE